MLLPGLMAMTAVQAANVNLEKAALKQKQQQQKKAAKKITHPCARKSAAQLNRRAKPYLKSITTHAKKYGVDSDLVKSVITIESCYRQKALSPKGAQGLMQLIPATAERFGIKNPYDSHQNILGGSRYLAWLSKRFKGDLTKVLAAYNAGEGRVERYNGIPPFRETRNYVHDVLAVYKKLKQQRERQKNVAGKPQSESQASVSGKQQPKRQLARTPQQLRQIHQRKQQLLRQVQLRKRQQQLRLAKLRKQKQPQRRPQTQQQNRSGTVVVIGKPGKPVYAPATQAQIVIGKPPISAAAQRRLEQQQQAQQAAKRAANRPVLRKARAVKPKPTPNPANFVKQQVNRVQGGRVRSVFNAPSKPGRGGWMANKALAPQLFKQQ